jgi:hypothetical protein
VEPDEQGVRQETAGDTIGIPSVRARQPKRWGQRVAADGCAGCTGWASRAARLLRRLLEIVRSMMAPQLMHFHA